jgi:Holliday junction resolvase
MASKEKKIENEIIQYLRDNGWIAFKYDQGNRSNRRNQKNKLPGISDIIAVGPKGKFLAVEVKKIDGVTSDDQFAFLNMVNSIGGIAFVARSVDDVVVNLMSRGGLG